MIKTHQYQVSITNLNLLQSLLTYNISKFDSKFTWLNLSWAARGDAITNPGGQIKVNFTGFHNKDPGAPAKSCFSNPIPHINITFVENQTGILVTNTTFYNVSNSEAGLSLAIGYKSFHSGFLIQINDLNTLKLLATDQISDSGMFPMPGSLKISEYDYIVAFEFKQDNGNQNSTMIYDKKTGILVYSKVESVFGPDLEIFLSDYLLNFQRTMDDDDDDDDDDKKSQSIHSFPLIIISIVLTLTSVAIILKTKNRFKKIY